MKLKLFGDRVIVIPDEAQKMARGFHLVEKWRGPVTTGIVLAVGSKVSKCWPELREGDRVLVKPNSGEEFRHEDVIGRMFESRDVLMILNGKELTECAD